PEPRRHVEEVEVSGHIIDSLILPKVLDVITSHGGTFQIKQMSVGQFRHDPSYALVEVEAPDEKTLHEILAQIADHGAIPTTTAGHEKFEFMSSTVSTEKPKGVAIREIAAELLRTRRDGGKTLVVGGPAIVHTGSGEHLCRLIREGYINKLFAGNALATHDIEQCLF